MWKYRVNNRREVLLIHYDDGRASIPSKKELLEILPYEVSIQSKISFLDDDELPDLDTLVKYITENSKSHWYKQFRSFGYSFYFKSKNDAMLFKLRWG